MKLLRILFFLLPFSMLAQIQISGIIKDASTNTPLPFASITTASGAYIISDVDGKFSFQSLVSNSNFTVSFIGFNSEKVLFTPEKKFQIVVLTPQSNILKEVIIQNNNPALALIKKVIREKEINNPQKKLNHFEFNTYNKLIVTANPDSISSTIDSVFIENEGKKALSSIDSSNYKFRKLVSKQHLFQSEKASFFQFDGTHLKETVVGSRMAGLKQPIYEILGFNLQSFSIYDSRYELFETKYVSPIASDGIKNYNYKILDTIAIDSRTTVVIYFKNKKKKNAAGLEGLLYIDSENASIAKAVMRIKGVLDITGIHEFSYLTSEKIWFPKSKHFKIVKGKNDDDLKILGGTIQFEGDSENFKNRKKQASDYVYLLSDTYFSKVRFNVDLTIKRPAIAIEIKENAATRSELFWNSFRKDSLSERDKRTYVVLDSISIKNRIENRLLFGRKIVNGFIPIDRFDLDLRTILSYNNYEGFRLGLGGVTNEKLSKIIRLEGYGAYGTKDGNFKYNGGAAIRLGKFSSTWMGGSYTDDVKEIASTSFAIDKRAFKLYDPRPINVSTFFNYKSWKGFIETKIIPKTESIWQLVQSSIEPKFNYVFTTNGKSYLQYNLTTAMVSLQWNPFSQYMQTPLGRLEIDKRFPKFTFQFTQSLGNLLGNDFDFGKFDFRTDFEKKYLNGQKTTLLAELGYAFGAVPLTHLYNTAPNNLTKDRILQRITIAGKNSFETMYFNEFFSSQYIYFQLKHGSKRITLFNKVKPSLVFVTRMAWGNLENPEQHSGIEYKTLNKGFFESGIELNQIYKGFGLTGFYRYGPNQLPRFEDNLALKLSFILDLGF